MSFMQQSVPPAPPPNLIPKVSENRPIQIGIAPKKVSTKPAAPAPPPAPAQEMRGPSVNIDDLLKDIKAQVLPPSGPPPPAPEKVGKSALKTSKAGSTGKNSVVIKL
jgi:hypothetical protein